MLNQFMKRRRDTCVQFVINFATENIFQNFSQNVIIKTHKRQCIEFIYYLPSVHWSLGTLVPSGNLHLLVLAQVPPPHVNEH